MPRFEPNQFHDPSLRRAVRRTWGGERAPAELRGRLRQMIRSAALIDQLQSPHQNGAVDPAHDHGITRPAPAGHNANPGRAIRGWHNYAAAALVLLCIGIIGYQGYNFYREFRPATPSFTAASILPPATVASLVAKHDQCAGMHDHHTLTVSRQDFARIGRTLGRELGCEVLSADLSNDGWQFNGASTCWVGKSRTSHLLFNRDGASLSLYTMPTSPCGGTLPGWTEEALFADHLVAAFQKDGALHAIVVYDPAGELQMDQVTALRDRLRESLQKRRNPNDER